MRARFLVLLFLLVGVTSVGGQDAGARAFEIPGHGVLRLELRDGWKVASRSVPSPPSTVAHITPAQGNSFDVQITSIWLPPSQAAKTNSTSIRDNMQRSGKALLTQSVEKAVSLKEIHGDQSIGWYYALTDKSPAPGEFGYLVQGSFLTGEVLSVFTLLCPAADSPAIPQVIEVFTAARHAK